MNSYIVVEGQTDRELLGRLLPKDLADRVTIVVANGKSAAVSLCRSILSQRQAPTVLVIDSDTTDEEEIRERYVILNDLLRPAAGTALWLVQLAVPEIEAILFSDINALETGTGVKLSETDLTAAKYRPKEVLGRVLKQAGIGGEPQLISRFDETALAVFGRHSLATNIIEFLQESLSEEKVRLEQSLPHAESHSEHIGG
ncbi:MAG: hypothetical protein AB1646_10075 [Thermodesulfobacteriota bacterium]